MKRFSVAFTLLFTALGSPAFSETDPLSLIPADSAVVVRIKAPQSTFKAVSGFVEQVQPGVGPMIQAQATPLLGAALQNVTLAGIDLSRDIYVVLNVAEGKPQGFMLVPASDAAAVKENTGVGQGYQFVEADGWVASSVHSLDAVQACIDGNAKSINDSLSKETLSLLGNGHLGVALQGAPLRTGMAKELEQAQSEFDEFLTMMSTQLTIAAPAGANLDGVVDIYRVMGECVFQVIEDSSSAAVSVTVSNDALTIEESLTVTGGSKTGQLLAANHPGTMEGITGLPGGLLAYMGFHGNSEMLLGFSEKLTSSIYEGENGEKMKESMRYIKEAGIGSYFGGMGLNSGDGGLLQAAGRAVQFITPGELQIYAGAAGDMSDLSPTYCIHTFPLPLHLWKSHYTTGAHVVTPSIRHIPPQCTDPKIKCRSRMHWWLADQESHQVDPSAISLCLDLDGNVTETSGSNFLIYTNGEVLCPSPRNILRGISIETTAELCEELNIPFVERDFQVYDVINAEEAWLASTPYCLAPVTQINGVPIGTGVPGPLLERILSRWSQRVGLDIRQQIMDSEAA